MIEVNLAYVGHLLLSALLVEAVQRNQRRLFVVADADARKYLLTNCGLARSCASRNAHKDSWRSLAIVDFHTILDGSQLSYSLVYIENTILKSSRGAILRRGYLYLTILC